MRENTRIIEGFECYAPYFISDKTHFPVDSFKTLYELEKGHFWFESRNRIIIGTMRRFLSNREKSSVLEVGCGTGFVLEGIANAFPNFELEGTELYLEGLKFARSRSPHLKFFQSDARALPFESKYDAICAFDVVEHIEEDVETFKSIRKALNPGGYFFVSVPQHMWLWSKQDEHACHKRRYTRKELIQKLMESGFSICYSTSFVFVLLPLMLLIRMRDSDPDKLEEFKISRLTNYFLSIGMKIDELFIKIGVWIPFGGSLLCVAKKEEE